jgi:hypothetical protein
MLFVPPKLQRLSFLSSFSLLYALIHLRLLSLSPFRLQRDEWRVTKLISDGVTRLMSVSVTYLFLYLYICLFIYFLFIYLLPEELIRESKHGLFHLAAFSGMTLCIVSSVGTDVSKIYYWCLHFSPDVGGNLFGETFFHRRNIRCPNA